VAQPADNAEMFSFSTYPWHDQQSVLPSVVGPGGCGSSVADVLEPGGMVQVLSQIVIFLPYDMQL